MSEVKVTREHRDMVLARKSFPFGEVPEVYRRWAERGLSAVDFMSGSAAYDVCERYEDQAKLAAEAEHRVRAAVIADLRGLLERAYKGDCVNRTLVVDADSIELLIETLEAANG